jgi:hypothetical protein
MRCAGIKLVLLLGLTMTGSVDALGRTARDPDQPTSSATHAEAAGRIAQGVTDGVTDRTGGPIADARIVVTSLDEPARSVPAIAILSDAQGRFAWPLPPGRYRLTALSGERELASKVVEVAPGAVARLEMTTGP